MMQTRRQFIRLTTSAGLGALVLPGCASQSIRASAGTGWDSVPGILARIRPPRFPDRDFNITSFGANQGADNSEAFRRATLACNQAGGGRVLVPAGRFQTGPIHLLANVNLHVARGATIAFDKDPNRYLPQVLTRWEGMEVMNYSPFIYALDQNNIAITGEGTLDGQAGCDSWWDWRGEAACAVKPDTNRQRPARERLYRMMEQNVPLAQRVFGAGDFLRPNFIQPFRCNNVLIEGVTVINSPMWEIHPVHCNNVTVRRVTVRSHGPNNDGCNPESCRDVLIEECEFDTGDDCIAIKSGRNEDGRRIAVPSENIIVRKCRMKEGHGGVTIGSEISGNCRNVFVEDCVMDSPVLDRALRFKNNAARGGLIENVYMRNCEVGQVADAVLSIDYYYEEGTRGAFKPVVRNVQMENVTSRKSKYALYLRGFENAPIYDVTLKNCTFENVERENVVEHVVGLRLDDVRMGIPG
jgi:polygalacturonase